MHLRRPTHYFWLLSITYARLFGRAWLAPFHHAMLNLSLHALGYDNCYGTNTGEEWFVRTILRKHAVRTCVDVGANVGAYSSLLLSNLPEARVLAIEPSAHTATTLEANLKPFGSRITISQSALSNSDGTASLYIRDALSETATLGKELAHTQAQVETVPLYTLDTLLTSLQIPSVDFVKIDTEGYEREVLQGMSSLLATHPPAFIQFEFNHLQLLRGYSVYDITRLLPGYTYYRLLPRGMVPVRPRSFKDNIYMFSNYIAVRNDIAL